MSTVATAPRSRYEPIAGLPLRVDSYALEPLVQEVAETFQRHTTVIHLHGGGHEGVGEDVTYAAPDQLALQLAGPVHALQGEWTLDSFSAHLAKLNLFPAGPSHRDFRAFRRWAFESAALDLALRQSGRSLAQLLGRSPQPVNFVVSPGPEDSAQPVLERLAAYPNMRLKLMPTRAWDDAVIRTLADTSAVDVVDLKGQYDESVPVALPADLALYRRVLAAFPDVWIEDPAVTRDTHPLLRRHRARLAWDAPVTTVADISRLPFPPGAVNMKPSRFGSVRALLDAYAHCEQASIPMYGGGMFELGPGRPQIQLLASLFHPHAPNDVAPGAYNRSTLESALPTSPLPAPTEPGFGGSI